MLNDEELEALRLRVGGKIGVVDYSGHQLVFKRPSRENVREYRRKQESPIEKMDAMDQLAQVTLVAFDGEQDGVKARNSFLGFLDEFPLFTSAGKPGRVLSALAGLIEDEDAANLGKGASVRSSRPKTTPTDSPSGLAASSEAKN